MSGELDDLGRVTESVAKAASLGTVARAVALAARRPTRTSSGLAADATGGRA